MTVLRSGAASDVGRVRRNNEDNYLLEEPLFAVADGMGGAAAGEEASLIAVTALKTAFEADPSADGLANGVRDANRAVFEKAQEHPELRGMGTTMTAVALVEDEDDDQVLAVANVGDSRVYLLRDGRLDQITDDHSVPEELLRAGRITPAEAAQHPQRNMLTRVLGNERDVEVDCFAIIPYRGDRLVLASDGLFNEVDHDEIAGVARRQADPDEAAAELVRLAREHGGNDNITVVVVDVVDDGDRAARASATVAASPAPARSPDAPEAGAAPGEREHWSAPRSTPQVDPTRTPGHQVAPPPAAPRRFTLRLAVFLLALVVLAAGAAGAVGFFARAGYFVGEDENEVIVYKGRPGGLLWFRPTVAERTDVALSDLRPARVRDIRAGKEQPSLSAARRYVAKVQEEATPTTTTTTTTTTLPAAPGTSVPPSPATVVR